MKLDYDLIREILLKFETMDDGVSNYPFGVFIRLFPAHDIGAVRYHTRYLADADYIFMNDADYLVKMTPAGHMYLDAVRNNGIWAKTKKKIQPLGQVPLAVIIEVAKALTLGQLGL